MEKNRPNIGDEKQKNSRSMKQEEKGLELLNIFDQVSRTTHAQMTLISISDTLMFLAEKRHYTTSHLSSVTGVDREYIEALDKHKFSKDLMNLVILLHELDLTLDIKKCWDTDSL